ncbi:hypothetical protein [Mycolicibacterium sp.]|uniref:hypothetical protein n=1 Tax=Mycolicibacterium sp. TaxID=2320850 RepID=UPI0037CA1A73|nr:hypothetical protein [Mycobacterium sp. DSM 3803]
MLTIHDRGCELAAADAATVLIDGRSRSGKSMLTGRLYDPRGHIRITTQLGDGHDVPYLSPGLLAELFDHPHPENP